MVQSQLKQDSLEPEQSKALYILQIIKSKFSELSMRVLKCLLFQILRSTELKHIILELYFDQAEFSPIE